MTSAHDNVQPPWLAWIWQGLAVLALAGATLAVVVYFDPGEWSVARLAHWMGELGWKGPLMLAGLMIAAVIIGPIPTIPISMTAGAVYGPWLGTAYAACSALIGAVVAFLIARFAGRNLNARMTSSHIALCPSCSDRLLFLLVFLSRLFPVVSFALVSYAAGLTAMSLHAFALATFFGMPPMTVVYVAFGASVEAGAGWMTAGTGAFVVLILASPWLIERYNPLGLREMFSHLRCPPYLR